MLTWCGLFRFSQLISSTHPQPLRLASTNSRQVPIIIVNRSIRFAIVTKTNSTSHRLSSQLPDLSSWTSSAPAASPSPLSSRTHKQLLSAPAARQFSASRPVERPDLPRDARSGESRLIVKSRLLFFISRLMHATFLRSVNYES